MSKTQLFYDIVVKLVPGTDIGAKVIEIAGSQIAASLIDTYEQNAADMAIAFVNWAIRRGRKPEWVEHAGL